eukprot:TRINITY_DN11446_c0_g1_i1.p1 TRINITY_DN11446_c0_g1~~TRINITY_DN11446_c0_g1_i1.p1  ORF type:complete len:663 (-),score=174.31 TRINITY_DN11446_c0_g1_i1:93-2003(-)
MSSENADMLKKGGCGCCVLIVAITAIILGTSNRVLGPEDQLVLYSAFDKEVVNGPASFMVAPGRKTEFRKAVRLGPREYAAVKHAKSGKTRHEAGGGLLFLGAWDELLEVKPKIVIQKLEYIRLVDELNGDERVVVGPNILVPGPLEKSKDGVQPAVVISAEKSVVLQDKASGTRTLVTEEGLFFPKAYEVILEVRSAVVVGPHDYAVVEDTRNAAKTHYPGPLQLKLGIYERLVKVSQKVVLEKDEYVRFVNKKTGIETVHQGPSAVIPDVAEEAPAGIEKAVFLSGDKAVLLLNKTSGLQRLASSEGTFCPAPYEKILEVRPLIRVLPHEAAIVRTADGVLQVYQGNGMDGTAFFLQPYTQLLDMKWSVHSSAETADGTGGKAIVQKVDLRAKKMFFKFEVPTSDNVKLLLEGTVFWQVLDVMKMVNTTGDPEGDVWQHTRSALIQAVSKATLNFFMANLNNITLQAYEAQTSDGFYDKRGVAIQAMELTGFECVDPKTAAILQQIIQETTNRINRLQVQQGENDVKAAELAANIQLEQQRTLLINAKAVNERLRAEMNGSTEGLKMFKAAETYVAGLNDSVSSVDSRVDLYKLQETIKSRNIDTENLANGNAKLFLTPEDMNLKLGQNNITTA